MHLFLTNFSILICCNVVLTQTPLNGTIFFISWWRPVSRQSPPLLTDRKSTGITRRTALPFGVLVSYSLHSHQPPNGTPLHNRLCHIAIVSLSAPCYVRTIWTKCHRKKLQETPENLGNLIFFFFVFGQGIHVIIFGLFQREKKVDWYIFSVKWLAQRHNDVNPLVIGQPALPLELRSPCYSHYLIQQNTAIDKINNLCIWQNLESKCERH